MLPTRFCNGRHDLNAITWDWWRLFGDPVRPPEPNFFGSGSRKPWRRMSSQAGQKPGGWKCELQMVGTQRTFIFVCILAELIPIYL